jgi:hypothetical protein
LGVLLSQTLWSAGSGKVWKVCGASRQCQSCDTPHQSHLVAVSRSERSGRGDDKKDAGEVASLALVLLHGEVGEGGEVRYI